MLAEWHELRKAITCSICLDYFDVPVTLAPCGHTYCSACISTHMRSGGGTNSIPAAAGEFSCPICNVRVTKRSIMHETSSNRLLLLLEELVDSVGLLSNISEPLPVTELHIGPCQLPDATDSIVLPNGMYIGNEAPVVDLDHHIRDVSVKVVTTTNVMGDASIIDAKRLIIDDTEVANRQGYDAMVEDRLYVETAVTDVFPVDALVVVAARTWAGINKLGGTARVLAYRPDASSGELRYVYDVKYVLDNTVDRDVLAAFLQPYRDLDRKARGVRSRPTNGADILMNNSLKSCGNKVQHTAATSGLWGNEVVVVGGAKRRRSSGASLTVHVDKENREPSNDSLCMQARVQCKVDDDIRRTIKRKAPTSCDRPSARPRMVLLASGLSSPTLQKIQTLADQFSSEVTLTTQFDSTVTHLIVSANKEQVVKNRTMKYAKAIACGLWILSATWVLESIRKGALQLEDSYEIRRTVKDCEENAPKRARCAMQANSADAVALKSENQCQAGLFSGLAAVLYGDFPTPGPPMSDISFLLQRSGCIVYPSIDRLLAGEATGCIEGKGGQHCGLQCRRWLVVYSCVRSKEELQLLASQRTELSLLAIVPYMWVLDSVTNYKRQNISDSW